MELTDIEKGDIQEALAFQLAAQRAALKSANEGHSPAYFTPRDFAIPRLVALLNRFGGDPMTGNSAKVEL